MPTLYRIALKFYEFGSKIAPIYQADNAPAPKYTEKHYEILQYDIVKTHRV